MPNLVGNPKMIPSQSNSMSGVIIGTSYIHGVCQQGLTERYHKARCNWGTPRSSTRGHHRGKRLKSGNMGIWEDNLNRRTALVDWRFLGVALRFYIP
jgi:hypothetical protein